MENLSRILHDLDQGNINVEDAKRQILDLISSLHINFAVYLTGHDKETIEQMYNDWKR